MIDTKEIVYSFNDGDIEYDLDIDYDKSILDEPIPTYRQLYVCSKPLPNDIDNTLRPRLIGILREIKPAISPDENGEYEFEYRTGGEFKEFFLKLPDMNDPNKIYNNEETKSILKQWLPGNCRKYFDISLKAANLIEYDEWLWLQYYGKIDIDDTCNLYKTLPENVIKYE